MKIPAGASLQRDGRRRAVIAGSTLLGLLILLGVGSGVYTDLLWFRETGFQKVFSTTLGTKALLGLAFGLVFAAALLLNLWIVQKVTHPARVFSMRDQIIERYRMLLRPYVRRVIVGGSILFGLFAGSSATAQWKSWLLFRNAQSFGEIDPVFGKDLGFFVFKLPFHRFVFAWGFTSLVVITIAVGLAHYFMGGIKTEGVGPRVAPQVKAHLSVLLGLIVLLKGWGYRLDQFHLLYSGRGGQVTGASYTDVNAQLPALKLLVVIAIVCALLFLINIRFRGWVLPAAGIGILALTSIIAGGVYPAVVQRLRVNPVERAREKPFIERNIQATRKAFRIDNERVKVDELPATAPLEQKTLKQNQATVDNIRLWSPDVLVDAYTQLQRITNYYEFLDVDIDRYKIGGTQRQVMLSAREVDPAGLPDQARTWVNNHLVYTHGYGVVASRVDKATVEGQPEFIIRDVPARSVPGAPELKEPRIYFGEKGEGFVVVNTGVAELDYPSGTTSVESSQYKGTGGVEMSGLLRRAAFAWRFKDPNLLISSAIKTKSRIMFRRKVAERVAHVAPFLQLDHDPYPVIADGRLTWVQDGYTTTGNYPYAQRISLSNVTGNALKGQANYIRNSVKATVDALNGTITLYVWDETDPIIQTWKSVFPDLLRPKSQMPPSLREHMRYPEDMFLVQADRYATYHITDPVDFYSKNDVWQIARDPSTTLDRPLPPYYVLMKLPRGTDPEFVLMVPFTPFSGAATGGQRRQNMTAWLAARSDGDAYGQMLSFTYSKDTNVFGPEQVDARIQQDQQVATTLTLLDPKKERILKGNLLVIPVGDAILYVQPLYLISPSSKLPEFKRVVVVTREKVRIAETLTEALSSLFGDLTPPSGTVDDPEDTVADLINEALRHYNLSLTALRALDYARFGREQAAMKSSLDRAQRAVGGSPPPSGSPSPSPSPSPSG